MSERSKYMLLLSIFFQATTNNVNSESPAQKGQSSNEVAYIDVDDKKALNISIDGNFVSLPFFEQPVFTNPLTYSREETTAGLQEGINQFWADDAGAEQGNIFTNMQNPPQVQQLVGQGAPPSISAPDETQSSNNRLAPSAFLSVLDDQLPVYPNIDDDQDQTEVSASTNQTVSDPERDDSAVEGFPPTVPRISNDQDRANGAIRVENPVTEAPAPTSAVPIVQNRQRATVPIATNASIPKSSPTPAVSATPDVEPIRQARTRAVKRPRETNSLPQAAELPANRNGRLAAKRVKHGESNETKPPRYRPITPNIFRPNQLPCQVNMPNEHLLQRFPNPASADTTSGMILKLNYMIASLEQQEYAHQQAQMGMDPRGFASSHNANTPMPPPVAPRQHGVQMTMGSSPLGLMSSPNQSPTSTEEPLPHLNIPSRPGRRTQKSWIDMDPPITVVTTEHPSLSRQHGYDPSLGNLQPVRYPAMYPMNVSGACGYNYTSGNHQTGSGPTSSQPNMPAQYNYGPPSEAGLPVALPFKSKPRTADELQRRAHEAAIRARNNPAMNQNNVPTVNFPSSMGHQQPRGNGNPMMNPTSNPSSSSQPDDFLAELDEMLGKAGRR
jgi:hypothetical protein